MLRKMPLLFRKVLFVSREGPCPRNTEQRGQVWENITVCKYSLLHCQVAHPRSHQAFCTCTKNVSCMRKCFCIRWDQALTWWCALATLCDLHLFSFGDFWRSPGSWRRFSPLRLGCPQTGTGSCTQVCKFKEKKHNGRSDSVAGGRCELPVSR